MSREPIIPLGAFHLWEDLATTDPTGGTNPPPPIPAHVDETTRMLLEVVVAEEAADSEDGQEYITVIAHADDVPSCTVAVNLLAQGRRSDPVMAQVCADADLRGDATELSPCLTCLRDSATLQGAMAVCVELWEAAELMTNVLSALDRPRTGPPKGYACMSLVHARDMLHFPQTRGALPSMDPRNEDVRSQVGSLSRWWKARCAWWSERLDQELNLLRAVQTGWDGDLIMVTPARSFYQGLGPFVSVNAQHPSPDTLMGRLTAAPLLAMVQWQADKLQPVLAVPADTDLWVGGTRNVWVSLGPVRDRDHVEALTAAFASTFSTREATQAAVDEFVGAMDVALRAHEQAVA